MSNSLQYAATQVSPYLVAAVRRLPQANLVLAKPSSARVERDELRTRVLRLEEEKCKFDERYDLLDGEKAFVEEHIVNLDGSVWLLAERVEDLVGEKGLLEEQVKLQVAHLAVEESKRKVVEGDMVWLLREGIIRVVDRVIENPEFSTGIQRMKVACFAR